MNKLKNILFGVLAIVAYTSCQQNLDTYDTPECRLNFLYYDYYGKTVLTLEQIKAKSEGYNVSNYSFFYEGLPERDTLWFKVGTMGFLSDTDRPIALEQIMLSDTIENAQPGVHFVPFDDPEIAHFYRVPAHADTVSIPVILINDPSLANKEVVLGFGFVDNGVFQPGYDLCSSRSIRYTAAATRPNAWSDDFFGTYGPVKHQLMMEWTGEKWDNEYILRIWNEDYAYVEYMNQWFHYKLEEENAKRLADPAIGDIYREANGDPIVIDIR